MGRPRSGASQPGGKNAPRFYQKHGVFWDARNPHLSGKSQEELESKVSAAAATGKAVGLEQAHKVEALEAKQAERAKIIADSGVKKTQQASNRQIKSVPVRPTAPAPTVNKGTVMSPQERLKYDLAQAAAKRGARSGVNKVALAAAEEKAARKRGDL